MTLIGWSTSPQNQLSLKATNKQGVQSQLLLVFRLLVHHAGGEGDCTLNRELIFTVGSILAVNMWLTSVKVRRSLESSKKAKQSRDAQSFKFVRGRLPCKTANVASSAGQAALNSLTCVMVVDYAVMVHSGSSSKIVQ